jgi:hypothetical protein
MQLQTIEIDGKTYALVSEGKPLYKADDGKEVAFDAPATVGTISRITEESKGFKQRAQTAEEGLKKFEAISDPAAAVKALETLANLDQKKLVDAGEVQKVKDEAIKAVRAEYEPVVAERDTLMGQLQSHIKGSAFANSKFVAEKVAVPRHMLERTYGDSFKVEDGKLVPYDPSGNKLYSRAKPGEVADFDEAIELLISADPFKDHILKGSGAAGSGAQGGGGPNTGGQDHPPRRVRRAAARRPRAKVKDGFKVTD